MRFLRRDRPAGGSAPGAAPDAAPAPTIPPELREVWAEIEAVDWYHSIDLGNGLTTPGKSRTVPLGGTQLPDFQGRSVLDIGAFDGYYSFLAERAGATRVVALDHYIWGVDMAARTEYWNDCARRDVLPDRRKDTTDFWRPDLPRRRGFELAHRL
ncbi:MAG TPA: hypothetical protein VGR90_05540, partial [Acidimicrobiales bacterium]|nr:hypothetical protein [Acidimicrobiales bacterium]